MKCSFDKENYAKQKTIINDKDLNKPQTRHWKQKPSQKSYPIPRGETPYCVAKRAEYQEKDLDKALHFYDIAIKENDRRCSAVKDMAGLLHSRGKTQEAIELMEKYEVEFVEEKEKFLNLLENLKKQQHPTGSAANKWIKIFNIPSQLNTTNYLKSLFREGQKRIQSIETFVKDNYSIIKFNSHSGARKSLDTLQEHGNLIMEWMSCDGKVQGPITYNRKNQLIEAQQQQYQQKQTYSIKNQQNQIPPNYQQGSNRKYSTESMNQEIFIQNSCQSQMKTNQKAVEIATIKFQNQSIQRNSNWNYCFLFAIQHPSQFFIAVDEQWADEPSEIYSLEEQHLFYQEEQFYCELLDSSKSFKQEIDSRQKRMKQRNFLQYEALSQS